MIEDDRFEQIKHLIEPGQLHFSPAILPIVTELIEGYEDVRERYARAAQTAVNASEVLGAAIGEARRSRALLAQLERTLTSIEARVEESAWLSGEGPKSEEVIAAIRAILAPPPDAQEAP